MSANPQFRLAPQDPSAIERDTATALGTAFAPLTSPRLFYALGFAGTVLLLWILFNPTFGSHLLGQHARKTVIDTFRGPDGSFVWDWSAAQRLALLLLILAAFFLVTVLAKPALRRGLLACFACVLALVSLPPATDRIHAMTLYVGFAILAGSLMAVRSERSIGGQRLFWVGLALVAATQFMPLSNAQTGLPGYRSVATELVSVFVNPPPEFDGVGHAVPGEGYDGGRWHLFLALVGPILTLVLLVLGLVAAAGLRPRWLPVVAALLTLALVIGTSIIWAADAAQAKEVPGLSDLQQGLHGLGVRWRQDFLLFLLPLAGGIRDASRPARAA